MDWNTFILSEQQKEYYTRLAVFLREQYAIRPCFPKKDDIFNAFKLTPYDNVKVVILGQDPYHEPGQAMGLSFSVPDNIKIPPSLVNIFKELKNEGLIDDKDSGDLTGWAKQGVLLLNSVLSVQAHKAASHMNMGWETFTNNAISELNKRNTPIVFMFWGRYARNKKSLITNPIHLILESAHPSPFSANNGFFGNNHFALCNSFLVSNGLEPIDWNKTKL